MKLLKGWYNQNQKKEEKKEKEEKKKFEKDKKKAEEKEEKEKKKLARTASKQEIQSIDDSDALEKSSSKKKRKDLKSMMLGKTSPRNKEDKSEKSTLDKSMLDDDGQSEVSTSKQHKKNRLSLKFKGSINEKSIVEDDDKSELSQTGKKKKLMGIKSPKDEEKLEHSSSNKFKIKGLHLPGTKHKNKEDQSAREDDDDKSEKKSKSLKKKIHIRKKSQNTDLSEEVTVEVSVQEPIHSKAHRLSGEVSSLDELENANEEEGSDGHKKLSPRKKEHTTEKLVHPVKIDSPMDTKINKLVQAPRLVVSQAEDKQNSKTEPKYSGKAEISPRNEPKQTSEINLSSDLVKQSSSSGVGGEGGDGNDKIEVAPKRKSVRKNYRKSANLSESAPENQAVESPRKSKVIQGGLESSRGKNKENAENKTEKKEKKPEKGEKIEEKKSAKKAEEPESPRARPESPRGRSKTKEENEETNSTESSRGRISRELEPKTVGKTDTQKEKVNSSQSLHVKFEEKKN